MLRPLSVCALLLLSHSASADTIAGAAGFDGTAVPGLGGYGWVLIHHDRENLLPRGAHLVVDYNTDTLRVMIDRARYDRVELAVGVFGEALLAGILDDYYRDGIDDRARGFFANYLGAAGSAKVDLHPHFVEVVVGGRRWFFGHDPLTAAALVLPLDAWVGELRAKYTYWNLKPDRSLWEPQRMWWRVRGIAAGVEGSADVRSEVAAWGAHDASFSPVDPRNDPSRVIVGAHQWLRAGVRVVDRVRLQLREEAHWLHGADDLVRLRVGGMNPYAVPLAGTPWNGYLADRLVAVEGSIHVRVAGEHEVGVLIDGVVMPDVHRIGDDAVHVLAGIGAFADLRIRHFQIDVRAGWSPTVQPGTRSGGLGLMSAIGWSR